MRGVFVDTARVNVCYRPLRIAFAIHSADRASLRRAIRLTYTFWGGRFNPIVFADRPEEARDLLRCFVRIIPCPSETRLTSLLSRRAFRT